MKISQIVEFLEKVKESEGDLEVVAITGFWIRTVPSTGLKVVVSSIGDGKSIEEFVNARS